MASTNIVKEFCDKHRLTMNFDQYRKTLNISNSSRIILSQVGVGSNRRNACNDAAHKCFDSLRKLVNRNEKINIHKFIGKLPNSNNNDMNLCNEDDLQVHFMNALKQIGWELEMQEYEIIPKRTDLGKGDLLFSKDDKLLIIETKGICWTSTGKTQKTKRHHALRKSEYQATKYASVLRLKTKYKQFIHVIACVGITPQSKNDYGLKLVNIIETRQQAKSLLQDLYDKKEYNFDALLLNLSFIKL